MEGGILNNQFLILGRYRRDFKRITESSNDNQNGMAFEVDCNARANGNQDINDNGL